MELISEPASVPFLVAMAGQEVVRDGKRHTPDHLHIATPDDRLTAIDDETQEWVCTSFITMCCHPYCIKQSAHNLYSQN